MPWAPGGVLHFSHAYAAGPDAARVFARYLAVRDEGDGPVPSAGPAFQLVFTMAREGRGWRIASQRTVTP